MKSLAKYLLFLGLLSVLLLTLFHFHGVAHRDGRLDQEETCVACQVQTGRLTLFAPILAVTFCFYVLFAFMKRGESIRFVPVLWHGLSTSRAPPFLSSFFI